MESSNTHRGLALPARIALALMALGGGMGLAVVAFCWPEDVRAELQVGPSALIYGALPVALLAAASVLFAPPSEPATERRDGVAILLGGAVGGALMLVGMTRYGAFWWLGLAVTAFACRFMLAPCFRTKPID